ncbi:tetratricopeptide repeat protein [Kitasatospora sp. LaBMicrA B282]|uniref:tetratricopeptide repeat protein n=1 Tax=Kitasatospora sp. LaBMicrA B282 TaxID=3420949 RepID=UPI003D0F02E0
MTGRREPNRRLAAVIEESGCTYEVLAKGVRAVAAEAGETLHTSRSAVHSWVTGGTPTGKTPAYIAEALTRMAKRRVTPSEIGLGFDAIGEAMAPDFLATASDLGRLVMFHRRDFLALAFATASVGLPLAYDHQAAAATLRVMKSGRRAGADEVATVRQHTEMFRTADDKLGGGHGLTTVSSYLADAVVPMLYATFPSETVRMDAFGAAAELATLVGWKCHDLGREGAAQRFYLLAYQLGCESDPAGHGAWMMRALTHQALDLNQTTHCVELAEAALSRAQGKVDRKTEALLLVTAARAYGASGQGSSAAGALLAAEDAMLAGDDGLPSYAAASGPVAATVASHTGRTLTEMKDHRAAERHYRAALAGRAPEAYQRVRGLTIANLAKSVAAQHRHEEAVILWNQCLDLMDGVASDRNQKELKTVRSTMAVYSRRGIPGAPELARRAAELASS